jgi:hypothetical protein
VIGELPFGKGKTFLRGGWVLGQVPNGWQVAGTYQYQPGGVLNRGNLFCYGDLSKIRHDLSTGCAPACNHIKSIPGSTRVCPSKNSANTAAADQARVFPQLIDCVCR